MTCAVSAAVREGAQAVICASTGNTAASAAAYAAKAGMRGAVIVPDGKIATGKLAQALMHGARVIALRGNFETALAAGPRARRSPSDRARELRQRVPSRGAEDRRVRARSRTSTGVSTRSASRSATPATSPPTGADSSRREPRRGCSASRRRVRRRSWTGRPSATRDGRQRDPDRQPSALGGGDGRDDAPRAARSAPSATRRSSAPIGCSPRRRGSSASRRRRRRSRGC